MTSPARRELYAGVMSGTSLDGVDAVLVDFPPGAAPPVLVCGTHVDFPSALKRDLLVLQASGPDEIARAARAANVLADLYAHALRSVCLAAGVAAHEVVAAGVHGQTIRHRPEEGWTTQINNPSRVAEGAYMTIVADFRMRDVAAGGQGAPLVPTFHAAMFALPERHRVIVNIGGIANITDLPTRGDVRGFDTGPGNVLLDLWCARHRGAPFDARGAWAASGTVDARLLETMRAEPYFALAPPKSTGRDLFDEAWLDVRLGVRTLAPADVQATLVALTATTTDVVTTHSPDATGADLRGGARNDTLRDALAGGSRRATVAPTSARRRSTRPRRWRSRGSRAALAGRPGNRLRSPARGAAGAGRDLHPR